MQLLAFMHAQFTFFHQGYDLLKEFDPFMKKVAGQVDLMRKDAAAVSKDMESRHSLVSLQVGLLTWNPDTLSVPHPLIELAPHIHNGI